MQPFRCPSCDAATIPARAKWGATSFAPATCPSCKAQVYVSGRQSSLWRSVEALIVTLIVIRALIGFSWGLVLLAVLVIAAFEALRLFLAPLVKLERQGFQ